MLAGKQQDMNNIAMFQTFSSCDILMFSDGSPAVNLSQKCGIALNDNSAIAKLGFASLLSGTLSRVSWRSSCRTNIVIQLAHFLQQHSDNSDFVVSSCAALASLSDEPIVQTVIAKKSSVEAITRALMKNYKNNLLVQQTSRMLANSLKSLTDVKCRQVRYHRFLQQSATQQSEVFQDIVRSLMPFVFARMVKIHINNSGECCL